MRATKPQSLLRQPRVVSSLALGLACITSACAHRAPAAGSAASAPAPAIPALSASESSTAKLSSRFAGVMPRGLTSAGAATLGEHLYVVGGYFGPPHDYSKEFQSGSVSRMNLATGAWEELPPIEPIQSPALVADRRYLYRLGGMRATNAKADPMDMRSVAEVARFDPAQGRWEALPSLPAPRSSHQAVIVGSTLYVVGGWALHGGMNESTWSDTLLTADLSRPELLWESHSMPFRVRAQGIAAHRGRLYVLGGIDPAGSTDRVRRYDIATRTWSDGPAMPDENLTTRAAVWRDELYANGADGNVYRLSSDEAAWEIAGALEFPRLFHELVGSERGPLVVGGIPHDGRGARVRWIERLSTEPAPAGVVLNLQAKSRAKNRQGALLWGRHLFVFGGNDSLGQHDFAPQNFVNDALRLDLGALDWRAVPEFPAARQSMQAVVVGGDDSSRALVLGGFGFESDRLSSQPDVFSHDMQKRQWARLEAQKLPEGLSQFGVAEWEGALWVFGGMSYDATRETSDRMRHRRRVLRLDLGAEGAGFEPSDLELGETRRAFAGALLDGTYYLTGGLKENFEPVQSCEAIDLKARQVTSMPCPSAHRLGAELVPLQGKLYLVGGAAAAPGKKERSASTLIEVFDPVRNAWTSLPVPVPLDSADHLRAFALQDQLMFYTAHRTDGQVQIALLDPEALAAGRSDYVRAAVPSPPAMP